MEHDGRISMSQGNGLDFAFTLSNATVDDSGAYEVVVEGNHPATGSLIMIKKTFHLNVGMFFIDLRAWYMAQHIACDNNIIMNCKHMTSNIE